VARKLVISKVPNRAQSIYETRSRIDLWRGYNRPSAFSLQVHAKIADLIVDFFRKASLRYTYLCGIEVNVLSAHPDEAIRSSCKNKKNCHYRRVRPCGSSAGYRLRQLRIGRCSSGSRSSEDRHCQRWPNALHGNQRLGAAGACCWEENEVIPWIAEQVEIGRM
jgi:hypothetical protein